MSQEELFRILLAQFLTIDEHRDRLIEKAQTFEQAQQVLNNWRQANLNQLEMGNKLLIQNSAELNDIVKELKTAQGKVDKALEGLQSSTAGLTELTSALTLIGKAVALGTQLVAIA
jgi:uncharacterized phage infection (PIP) family protein YhgE